MNNKISQRVIHNLLLAMAGEHCEIVRVEWESEVLDSPLGEGRRPKLKLSLATPGIVPAVEVIDPNGLLNLLAILGYSQERLASERTASYGDPVFHLRVRGRKIEVSHIQ